MTSRSFGASPLLWAAIVSLTVHSILAAMPLASQGRIARVVDDRGSWLEATLVHADAGTANADTLIVPVPLQRIADFALPPLSPPETIALPMAPSSRVGDELPRGVLVEPQPLQDLDRLGDLMSRLVTEFPVELDHPVRLRSKIVAHYPPAALAAGREGSVAVWILVDANGNPEEVQVIDGSEEFADAVREALQGAYFLPAQNNRAFIRYPVALEFRFGAPGSDATAAIAKDH